MAQTLRTWGQGLYLIVKSDLPPSALAEPLRREVARLDPDVPLSAVRLLDEYVAGDLSGSRVMSVLLATFGAVALLLAAVGIFGLVSYTVARRGREIGIRMALGANAGSVFAWVGRLGLQLAGVGVGIGLLAAVAVTRLIRTLLFGVGPLDPSLYAGLAVLLLAISLLATYLPARRAVRIDPAAVLKQEA
jgi:putative ABC transport system permease protein